MCNRKVDEKLANILSKKFFEIITSIKFTKDALSILKKKPKLILIRTDKLSTNNRNDVNRWFSNNAT